MKPTSVALIVEDLKMGELHDPPPPELTAAVRFIADSLSSQSSAPSALQVRKAMGVLNDNVHFDHAKTMGEAWYGTRGCDPTIQRRYAQALIELGGLDKAEALIAEALSVAQGSKDAQFAVEMPEYRGLRGRIRKQKFVQSRDLNLLGESIDEYLAQYSAKQSYWHGINVVALRLAEERLGGEPRKGETAGEVAKKVIDKALAAPPSPGYDHWPLATASEACLALHASYPEEGWCDKAELWLYRFLNHRDTNSFSIESYGRQIREIWGGNPLEGSTCADRLARIMQRHITRTQRRWSVDPGEVRAIQDHPEVLEKNFSGEKSFTVADLKRMLALCPNIGCVIDAAGTRLGTGFLMAGSSFGFAEKLVFVTNAHVISDDWEGSLAAGDASVTFEMESLAAGSPVPHPVEKILFTSNPGELGVISPAPEKLDVTIVKLKGVPPNVSGLGFTSNVPLPSPKTKAFVVGHPASGALQFSIHDSVLLDVCDYERLMHYRTPTDPGSSGSPVFNAKWEVIALHHAGSPVTPRLHGKGEYEANEGITIRSIRRKLGFSA